MLPPVYETIHTPAVAAIVGDKIARHGALEQDTPAPYITWQLVTGQPYDQISGAPPADFMPVQIDCWSMDDAEVEAMASAVRDAADFAGMSNRLRIDLREPDTKLYRMSVEVDFITNR